MSNLTDSHLQKEPKAKKVRPNRAPNSQKALYAPLSATEKFQTFENSETLERPIISSAVFAGIVQAAEALLVFTIGLLSYYVWVGTDESVSVYLPVIITVTFSVNIVMNALKNHSVSAYRDITYQSVRIIFGLTLIFVTIVSIGFLFKVSYAYSRGWSLIFIFGSVAGLIGMRIGVRMLVKEWTKAGMLQRQAVIVGGGEEAGALIAALQSNPNSDIKVLGLFDDRQDARSPDMVAATPKLGRVKALKDFARQTRVDLVIVSMPMTAESRVLEMIKTLFELPVDIRLSAHMNELQFRPRAYSFAGSVPMFDIADKPISDWNMVLKVLFDRLVGLTALVVLSPIMLITALAVKLDSKGPVFFKQQRHGFNNQLIHVYKFRSMYVDQSDVKANKLVQKNDPRVTRVGRFIRKTSLDELPQLINVLKGDLSLVGPRPHALGAKAANALYHEAVDGYFARHKVKPGITGWAQINGWRGETDTLEKLQQRVEHDLHYIEHWSIFLDIYILMMTPIALMADNENAY